MQSVVTLVSSKLEGMVFLKIDDQIIMDMISIGKTKTYIAKLLNISPSGVGYRIKCISEQKLQELLVFSDMDKFKSDHDTELLVDWIKLNAAINSAIDTLNPREGEMLRMRFGIDERFDHTWEEIALNFGVTRERVRQIVSKALRKIRHPTRRCLLIDFLQLH